MRYRITYVLNEIDLALQILGGAGGRAGGPQYQGNPAPHLQYYSNWSPPAGSNETAHGYFLERSHSARFVFIYLMCVRKRHRKKRHRKNVFYDCVF